MTTNHTKQHHADEKTEHMKEETGQGSVQKKTKAELDALKAVFYDQPDLLTIVTLGDLESQELRSIFSQTSEVFAACINQYVVGRTGAGKTSLGNWLFEKQVMSSTGYMDCTTAIGLIRLKG